MRIKLSEKYQKEREEICNKIITILDLKDFACYTIYSFKPNFECKRPYLNIIRSILRQQNYIFDCGTTFTKVENGIYKTSTKYKIFRNN